jgi:actin-related protein 6
MSWLIVDNGAGSIKHGYEGDAEPMETANLAAKINKSMQFLVGNQVTDFQHGSVLSFIRPFERGYLTNMQCEIDVWSSIFTNLRVPSQNANALFMTEPLLNPSSIQCDLNEVVFEYFGFEQFLRRPSVFCSNYEFVNSNLDNNRSQCCIVVDSGFSFSHAVPFIDSNIRSEAVDENCLFSLSLLHYNIRHSHFFLPD